MIAAFIEVPLNDGFVALIDAADASLVLPYRWRVMRGPRIDYAIRHSGGLPVLMHRQILGMDASDSREVDHRNSEGLDNRRQNLRPCTHAQNAFHRRMNRNNRSGWKGVCRFRNRWHAQIMVNGRQIHLGNYKKAWAAALAYDFAAIKHFGMFALTNDDLGLYEGIAT